MSYSIELREKAYQYYQACKNASEVCKAYQIDPKTFRSWRKRYEQTGSFEHQVKGGNATKVNKNLLIKYVKEHPDAYQHEIAAHFGCTPANICYLFKVLGITRKKRPRATKNKNQNR